MLDSYGNINRFLYIGGVSIDLRDGSTRVLSVFRICLLDCLRGRVHLYVASEYEGDYKKFWLTIQIMDLLGAAGGDESSDDT